MKISELKDVWNDSFIKEELSEEQIQKTLRIKRSTNIALVKILTNYKYGLITGAFFYILILTFLVLLVKPSTLIVLIPLVTGLIGTSYLFSLRTYNAIKKACTKGDNVKQTLESTILIIEKYVSFNSGTIYKYLMIPLALIMGIILGLFIATGDGNILLTINALEIRSIIKIILVIAVGSILVIPLSQNLVKKLYKQHLDELKQCLDEINNQ